jgi:hypothetical protein
MKKILSIALVVVILGGVTAFAVGPNENGVGLGNENGFGPNQFNFSEALMEKFEISQEEYDAAREEGKTIKDLVDDEEFYDVILAQHELKLGEMVEAGRITQEEADEALAVLKVDYDDGTCSEVGMNIRENYGQRNLGEGFGEKSGAGQGTGVQGGNGLRDQSCIAE